MEGGQDVEKMKRGILRGNPSPRVCSLSLPFSARSLTLFFDRQRSWPDVVAISMNRAGRQPLLENGTPL